MKKVGPSLGRNAKKPASLRKKPEVDHNAVRLGDVAALVLDEADRLLDLVFSNELTSVIE
jgi:superfamily II DNA/RNA helicase